MARVLNARLVVGILWGGTALASCRAPHETAPQSGGLNADGVRSLLDVMETVAALHPDFLQETATREGLTDSARAEAIAADRAHNAASQALREAVDRWLGTETYQAYFRHFTNITPETFRDVVLDLPHGRHPAPGGTGQFFYELLRNRGRVRVALNELLSRVDTRRVYARAERWVVEPPAIRPQFYLLYDGNAGSFAEEGKPVFNLNGNLDMLTLGSGISADALDRIEGVMAHELQHVLAASVLYPEGESTPRWQDEWIRRLTRGLVGEGIANHCNPPQGMKRQIYEDSTIVATLVERLNTVLLQLLDGTITKEEMDAWYRANYVSVAEGLLRAHLAEQYTGDALLDTLARYQSIRPDVEHALGWWMVSRISGGGTRRDETVALLRDPVSVYEQYNASASLEQAPRFRIAPQVIQRLRARSQGLRDTGS